MTGVYNNRSGSVTLFGRYDMNAEPRTRALGVLNGRDMSGLLLRAWADSAEVLLAADGAADFLLAVGATPRVTIGDLDSISDAGRSRLLSVIEDPEQDSTDCDKLLRLAASLGLRQITLTGVEGDLPDHILATYSSAASSSLDVRFAYRRGIGWLLKSGSSIRVAAKEGSRVSLIPINLCAGVNLDGVVWPLSEALLAPGERVSISNRATTASVSAKVAEGCAILFVEYAESEMPIWEP
jgi:thiamine pyrophosphokinase